MPDLFSGVACAGENRTHEVLNQEASLEKAYSRPHAAMNRTSAAMLARDQLAMDTPRGIMADSVMGQIISEI
jgi:hypothetical protein